ncbi:MAG: VWA domain-containing protein [Clostridia bacterium]|nr:VWA domain-containing protein [Clostridia bacterium]
MQNFQIHFTHPWLLLLLIPAVGFTLLSYFRLAKRYRRTRNRITSMVLHILVATLSIFVLCGMSFHYEVPNEENEIILLVDVSDTEETSATTRDEFVRTVLEDGRYGNFKIGVVTFGYDQEYAVPMTYEVNGIYNKYLSSDLPDTSATNIADALEYTRGLFTNPKTAKIVLVTDGKETDKTAESTIRTIVAQGTKIDVAHIPSSYEGYDVRIVNATLPEYHINASEECLITLNLTSNVEKQASFRLLDNGEASSESVTLDLVVGEQTLEFKHVFADNGLHKLTFEATMDGDGLLQNNAYTTYYYVDVYNRILVIDREEGASNALVDLLNENNDQPYELTIKLISAQDLPMTATALRAYDQVILNDIANADMPKGFDEALQSYVSDYGGGLFTAGGSEEDGSKSHSYNERDMYGTLYQEMLPVQAINYTPPLGVVFIVDRSGSMTATDAYGETLLRWSETAITSALNVLSERDYVGLVTLDDNPEILLNLTPRTQDSTIKEGIDQLDFDVASGGTVFPEALQYAAQMLKANQNITKRHIVLLSDGETGDQETNKALIENFYKEDGVTFSFIGITMEVDETKGSPYYNMKELTTAGGGRIHAIEGARLLTVLQQELNSKEITQIMINEEGLPPTISDVTSSLVKGLDRYVDGSGVTDLNKLSAVLYGYYGAKARTNADVILTSDYGVPLYAQWKYGKGTVGSFMCDLQKTDWSKTFMESENGIQFIRRAINNLMPSSDIRVKDISYSLTEENYTNQLSVYAELKEGETISARIMDVTNGESAAVSMNEVTSGDSAELRESAYYVTLALGEENGYTRCNFVVKKSGVYKIVLEKTIEGQPVEGSAIEFYKSFGYSEEYVAATEDEEAIAAALVQAVATRGNGSLLEDLQDTQHVFEGFVTALAESFDPRWLFMILAIVLFLADVAVRKFKFKWPHEIIREHREKKNAKKD